MKKDQLLNTLWQMNPQELGEISTAVRKIADLKSELLNDTLNQKGMLAGATLRETVSPPLPPSGTLSLHPRPPMRPPKEGSMRSFVHGALRRAGRPMKRPEVIEAVAKEHGLAINELLKAKIRDALANPHDPFVRKLDDGVYTFASPAREESLCL